MEGNNLTPEQEIEIGMKEEMEHKDITNGDPILTRKIVDAHLREDPHYYSKLKQVGLIKSSSSFVDTLKETIDKLEGSKDKELKDKILGSIQHFLEKYEKEEDTKSSLNIEKFLKGYERLAYLGSSFPIDELDFLLKEAKLINKSKHFDLPIGEDDKLEKVISIDSVAHSLHMKKNEDGSSQYKILDELANISKSFGEEDRNSRLLIIQNPDSVNEINKLLKLEVLQKSGLEKSSKFWKLMEKAIKEGIERLSNYEIIALREWVYAKI
jgi:hypothetical protein